MRTYGFFFSCLLFAMIGCSDPAAPYELIDRNQEAVELGRRLFFDVRLSSNNTVSCASCHLPQKAFSDGLPLSVGVEGRHSLRNAPSLYNVKFLKKLMFDGEISSLETQIMSPLLDHSEMNADLPKLFKKLGKDAYYRQKAQTIYHRPFDAYVLTRSIAAYERTLVSMNSKYDRFIQGKEKLTPQEYAGYLLFTKQLYCAKCHQPPYFTTGNTANNGLHKEYGEDQGRYRVTHLDKDKGMFKIPGLRNVALTTPYMHDGSMKTLLQVIRHYESGAQNHVNQSPVIRPFHLTTTQENNLVLFLKTLTDNPVNN